MYGKIRLLPIILIAFFMCACSHHRGQDIIAGPYVPAISSPIKVRVAEVFNDTHRVFDVDVIGLLWSGLEDSLKKRGMLWNPQMGGTPYTIVGHVVEYKKGQMGARLIPRLGDTVLVVTCELKEGDRDLGTIEAQRKVTFGSNILSRAMWRQVFSEVAEDVITQVVKKL